MALSDLFKKPNNQKALTEEEQGEIEYEEGMKCLQAKDLDNAREHLLKAANLGNLDAYAQLAIIASEFFRATHNITFRDAAIKEAGLAAMRSFQKIDVRSVVYYNIGRAYEEKAEMDTAIDYFEESARSGGCEAAARLAFIYAQNYETLDLAHTWLKKATDLGCDMDKLLEVSICISKTKRRIPQVNLNEEFVAQTFNSCTAKKDTEDVIEAVLFQKEYGFKESSRPVVFDKDMILEVRPQLEYTLGQLQDIHEDYASITTESVKNRYDEVDWTNDQTLIMAYLHLLLAAGLVKPVEIETGELQIVSEIVPTLLTTDPNYENWAEQNKDKILNILFGSEDIYELTPEEMCIQGRRYSDEKNYAKAVFCFEKAAEKGYAPAQASLAYMYSFGEGVQKDEAKAFSLYKAAADQGSAPAQHIVGLYYRDGNVVKKDLAEAVRWFELSAQQGYANAEFYLGSMYYIGEGVRENRPEGVKWLKKAAEHGCEDAVKFMNKFGKDFE